MRHHGTHRRGRAHRGTQLAPGRTRVGLRFSEHYSRLLPDCSRLLLGLELEPELATHPLQPGDRSNCRGLVDLCERRSLTRVGGQGRGVMGQGRSSRGGFCPENKSASGADRTYLARDEALSEFEKKKGIREARSGMLGSSQAAPLGGNLCNVAS